MRDEFDNLVGALWTTLGLPTPAPTADKRAAVTIDGFALTLREAQDGRRMLVECRVGRLSSDTARRAQQVRTILKTSPALLPRNRAGTFVEETPAGSIVTIAGVLPYGRRDPGALAELVEDVLQLAEIHSATLAGDMSQAGRRPTAPAAAQVAFATENLIFRP